MAVQKWRNARSSGRIRSLDRASTKEEHTDSAFFLATPEAKGELCRIGSVLAGCGSRRWLHRDEMVSICHGRRVLGAGRQPPAIATAARQAQNGVASSPKRRLVAPQAGAI